MSYEAALQDKTICIIGGASGIGLATATMAARAGAKLILAGNDAQQIDRACGVVPTLATRVLDIADRRSVEAAFVGLPAIDHLVITAGRRISGKISECDPDDLLLAVNERVHGAVYAVRAALPLLTPNASIVLTSGLLAQRPLTPGNAVFSASVGGIDALVRGLAVELSPMRVNAVAPGVTESPLFADVPVQVRDAVFARAKARSLVQRIGTVEDIAAAMVFLMCNGYVSGEVLQVDGGTQVN
jgi:NAD(P)-dependent dehydrogenase (short-subunit alcohol dehydrogenase family)